MPDGPDVEGPPPDNLYEGWEADPDPDGEYERHPAALRPAPYPRQRFLDLVAGVNARGQQYDIEVVPGPGGKKWVVRGWHMLLACRELGIEPRTAPPDRELRTDEDVEVYTAAEGSGRATVPGLRALRVKEVVYPAFKRRAEARRARGARLAEDEERGDALTLACDVAGAGGRASRTYVNTLINIEERGPPIYAALRKAIMDGEEYMVVDGVRVRANINAAKELLEDGWDDEARTWTMPERGGGGGPAPADDPIPRELFERIDAVKRTLGVSTRGLVLKALLRFRDEEGDAWARFLGRWREEREREARL